jgi:hypothetical protein
MESISDPPNLRFSGRWYTRGGADKGGLGRPHHWVARPGAGRATWWCGPLATHLALSFWLLPSSGEIWISGYFPEIADLQKYGVLTVCFPAESWLWQQALQ